MGLASDIQKARDGGHSDQDILTAIQKFSPEHAADIGTALSANHSPADVVSALQKFDQMSTAAAQPTGMAGVVKSVTDPLRYGVSNAAEGYQSTAKSLGGDGVVSDAMGAAGQMVAPSDYTPAHVTLNPNTWGDIPKALGEAFPAIAPDITAGEVGAASGAVLGRGNPFAALAGGVLGATASYGLRNYGDLLRRATAANTGNPDADPSVSDKARALAAVAAGGLLSRVGFKGAVGAPVRAAEGSTLGQVVPGVAKGAAIDAATGAGTEAVTQGLVDQKLDPSAIGGAAVLGGATGAVIKGVSSVKDFNAAKQFAGLTPEEALPVAQKLAAVHGDAYRGTASQDFQAIAKVQDDLAVRAKTLASDTNVTGHLKALQEADQTDPTRETLSRVQSDLQAGRAPDPVDMQTLGDSLGQFPHGSDLVGTLAQQATLNKIKSLGNYDESAGKFSGGMASSPLAQTLLNPVGHLGLSADLGLHLLGVGGPQSLGLPLAQVGTYGALRGIDSLSGTRSPVSQFVNRFGSPDTPNPFGPRVAPTSVSAGDPVEVPSTSRGPAFNDVLAQARADAKAKALADKAPDPVDVQLADIKRTSALMRNSETLETHRQKALASQAKQDAAPAASLDAQRSQAFVRSQVELQRAAAALAKQRDAALAKQVSESAKANDPLTLARNTSRLMTASENGPSTPAGPILGLARLKQGYAKDAEKAAGAPEGPQAIPMAQVVPKAPQSAPQAIPAAPGVVTIHHQDGVRNQVVSEINRGLSSVHNGVATRADARRSIVTDAQALPLSQAGSARLAADLDSPKGLLKRVFHSNNATHAKGTVETELEHFSHSDAAIIRDHFKNHVDPSTGRTFYSTWD